MSKHQFSFCAYFPRTQKISDRSLYILWKTLDVSEYPAPVMQRKFTEILRNDLVLSSIVLDELVELVDVELVL